MSEALSDTLTNEDSIIISSCTAKEVCDNKRKHTTNLREFSKKVDIHIKW